MYAVVGATLVAHNQKGTSHMKRLLALGLCATMMVSASATTALAEESLSATSVQYAGLTVEAQNSATALHFEDIRTVVLEYNYTVDYLKACISDAGKTDADDLYDAIDELEDYALLLSSFQSDVQGLGGMSLTGNISVNLPNGGDDTDVDALVSDLEETLSTVATSLYWALGANIISVESNISSLESSALNLDLTIDTTKNTLNDAINQVVKGAESLYVAIVTMESAMGDIDRGIAAMERAVALFQTQYDRGLISLFELETMEYQLRQLESAKETLAFQVSTTKMTLEGMVGMERTGELTLYPLTMPTEEELADVDYESNLTWAMSQNVDHMNAEAEYFSNMNNATYKRNWVVAIDNFKANFYVTCITVPEMERLVTVAEDTVAYQNRALEVTAKSYELGMSSQEEYLTALDNVAAAESDLYKAELNLFTEYRDYVWAKTYGIV